jgi:hypothetical protein
MAATSPGYVCPVSSSVVAPHPDVETNAQLESAERVQSTRDDGRKRGFIMTVLS